MDIDNLNERILSSNIDRDGGDLSYNEKQKALVIAKEMFHGNVGNGQATNAAINAVRNLR